MTAAGRRGGRSGEATVATPPRRRAADSESPAGRAGGVLRPRRDAGPDPTSDALRLRLEPPFSRLFSSRWPTPPLTLCPGGLRSAPPPPLRGAPQPCLQAQLRPRAAFARARGGLRRPRCGAPHRPPPPQTGWAASASAGSGAGRGTCGAAARRPPPPPAGRPLALRCGWAGQFSAAGPSGSSDFACQGRRAAAIAPLVFRVGPGRSPGGDAVT